jgi:CMP-N-acetylneuraminic acid synthetase
MPRIVALVPMRHRSERLSGKNYKEFAGLPLYHHIIQSLLASECFDEIVIDTDSPAILKDAAKAFPTVKLIERPEHLRAGTMPMNEILLHDVREVEADYYLQTHSTNPLLRPVTITEAVSRFVDGLPAYDSLFGVTQIRKYLWDSIGRPINHNPNYLMRTQDLPVVYEENSNLYVFSEESLLARRHRIGLRPQMFEIDALEAWDIDDEFEFQVGEFLFTHRMMND